MIPKDVRDHHRLFDAHTHIGSARHSGRSCDAGAMLGHMDRFGIDRALLIPFPVVDDYRAAHDGIARAIDAHPARFAGAACLNPFVSEQEYAAEVKRCAALGFRALKIQPQYQAVNPLSPRSAYVLDAAASNGLALVCHTGTGVPFALPSLWIPAARRYPELPIVLAHAGGGIYVLEAVVAAMECANVYIELSSLMPHHVAEVLRYVDPSRLLIGSDLPESIEAEFGKILSMEIGEDARHAILWQTAAKLFGA